ncbi:MAG: hypothetical protein ABF303_03510, partial [Desulfobacterales bacterium]
LLLFGQRNFRELQKNRKVNLNPQHAYQICEANNDIVLPGRKGFFSIFLHLPKGSCRPEGGKKTVRI